MATEERVVDLAGMSTERLYYADSHITEFEARVEAVTADGDGRVALVLDRTAFYPTGGGQPFDTGTLGAARVVDCIDGGEDVLHVVEGEVPAAGVQLHGRLDWPRRLEHIQQHTGQHILSQAFVELFGAQTRSFRMLTEASEIDLELKDPSDERVWRAAARANEVIWEDRPVRVHNLTTLEAAALPLRKDSAREGELRVIEIDGFDFSPCGGTHAKRTGEVGMIAVRSWARAKGMTRVEFVAGVRASADYRRANESARAVASQLTVGRDELAAAVARLAEDNKHLSRRNRVLEEVAAGVEAEELLTGPTGHEGGGARVVARTFEGRDAEGLKRLALALIARGVGVALLGSRDFVGARLIFARSADAPGDMGALMREACARLEGRGGGRPDMAQGGGPRAERLAEAIEFAAGSLKRSS